MLYLPPGYQSGSKLPMLVEVYGGPGFQKVLHFELCIFNPMNKCIYSPHPNLDLKWSVYMKFQVDKQWQGYSWPAYVAGTLGIVYAVIG